MLDKPTSGSGKGWKYLFGVGVLAGVLLLSGASFTMQATDQAAFCGRCHVMAEAAWTHKKSVHAKQTCNECHAPHNLAAKMPFKARAGTHDIMVNTFGKPDDVIHATNSTKEVVQANCRRCHEAATMDVSMNVKANCTDCHRNVPHFKRIPIDKRTAADE